MKYFAIATAKKAGGYLLRNFRKGPSPFPRATAKGITTKYDKESDKIIVREISQRFPYHNLLTEESGFIPKKSEYTWIIDALDGTTNYMNNNPFFAVSIALKKGENLLFGVVYAPFLQELFIAEKGKNTLVNGKKIHVSTRKSLAQSYFLSCEGGEETNRRTAKINALFHPQAKDLRKLGAASLEAAFVASGRADAYIVTKISPWDVAAGVLLVREAGGIVTDFKGKEWMAKKKDLVFSNGKIHGQVLKLLKRVR